MTKQPDDWYWIAINGPTCAISSLPMRNPMVTPTPEQMLGFPTLEEAQHAQHMCLQASMAEVRSFFESLRADVRAGRVRVIQPEHPQPHHRSPSDPTMWTESADVHRIAQQVHVKTTSN